MPSVDRLIDWSMITSFLYREVELQPLITCRYYAGIVTGKKEQDTTMEPTQPSDTKVQEPTQSAYSNPYDTTQWSDPYGIPIIPPPPPHERKWGLVHTVIVATVIVTVAAAISGYVLFGGSQPVRGQHNTSGATQVSTSAPSSVTAPAKVPIVSSTTMPTQAPTPTTQPVVSVPPTQVPTPAPTIPPAPPVQSVDAQSAYNYIVSQLDSHHTVSLMGSDNS